MNETPIDPASGTLPALRHFSYGLYIISTISGEKSNAQLANTVFQVTSNPQLIAISISKTNLTHQLIKESGVYAVSVISENATLPFIGIFGFRSGRDVDKLSRVSYKKGVTGCPLITENTLAAIEARVVQEVDAGTHTVYIGEIIGGEILGKGVPMTYAYYQTHLKGKTPPASPTYQA
jgi:ferric-chelate reductase [NAD(P)H]